MSRYCYRVFIKLLHTALFGTLTTLQSASRTRRCRTSSSANVFSVAGRPKNCIKLTIFLLFLLSRFQQIIVQSGSFGEPFAGPKAIFGGSLGFLGAPGWPKTGPKRARDAPRPLQDGSKVVQDGSKCDSSVSNLRTHRGTPSRTPPGGPTVVKIWSKLTQNLTKI